MKEEKKKKKKEKEKPPQNIKEKQQKIVRYCPEPANLTSAIIRFFWLDIKRKARSLKRTPKNTTAATNKRLGFTHKCRVLGRYFDQDDASCRAPKKHFPPENGSRVQIGQPECGWVEILTVELLGTECGTECGWVEILTVELFGTECGWVEILTVELLGTEYGWVEILTVELLVETDCGVVELSVVGLKF
ncbi:hypothetical protein CEXT_635551 [Caerostris extrusa]|uniref:Uncharacterized protein n=1 Tax=Caerostris extrusa TaxID=172846 RepID=A0AAV4XNL3_CAEEX|nr:hypothetical protein CEXT_635551 [Caerostris extrusa]